MANFRAKLAAFEKTFVGKLVLSAARAFIGVFVAAESQLFNAVANYQFGVLKSLVVALAAAGVTAAVRAVQHYFFDTPAA